MAGWLQTHSTEVQAVSAVMSAIAAVTVAALTFFLVRATNRYVRLVRDQLSLLKTQLAAPLLLEARIIEGVSTQLLLKCRHPGSQSSLSAILTAASARVRPLNGQLQTEASEEIQFSDILQPGKTWKRILAGSAARKIEEMPRPNFWRAVLRLEAKHQTVATLSISLQFHRAGQETPEEVTREYELRTRHVGGAVLLPL